MSYRLKVKEPLTEGIRRIALGQIEIAASELRENADADAAVHNARRALKRLRALLRLVRSGLDEATYRRETQRFAETGRLLAGERDRHVMRQTLQKLAAQSESFPRTLLPMFEKILSNGTHVQAPPDAARRKAVAKLAGARKAFSGNTVDGVEIGTIFQGLETVYRKARRLHRQCQRSATDEDFHSLRKAVQQHWRHMQLLSRAWPEALSARADEAKILSQILGEDHDLHVLASFASAQADAIPPEALVLLVAQAREAQDRLRERARLHGDRLFAERADDLIERLGTYWSAASRLLEVNARAQVAEEAAPQPVIRTSRDAVRPRRSLSPPRKARAPRKVARP